MIKQLVIAGCLLVGCLTVSQVTAQVNIKVGYHAGYMNPKVNSLILNQYSYKRNWLDVPLEPFNSIQGVQLGLRYKLEFVGFELTWYNRYKTLRSEGDTPANVPFDRNLYYRTVTYSFAMENYIGKFGFGGSFDVDNLRIRTLKSGRGDRFSLSQDFAYSSHFCIFYNFEANDFLTVSIKPYCQYHWTTFNMLPLLEELEPDFNNSFDEKIFGDNFTNFGIMLIFYNGRP